MPNNVILDLSKLAGMAPRSAELAARVRAGDISACFDASIFIESVERATADASAFVDRATVHVPGGDHRDALAAADGFVYLVGHLSGTLDLQAALDDARADDEPDD